LVALAETFASAGFVVLRCDLPYRQARPYGPPRPTDAVRDRQGLTNAVGALKEIAPGKVSLGGHSYGGRQASMLCAEQPELGEGLLLCSYPLHPPGKPDRLRTQHLPTLQLPVLFVHGTRDPFGTIEELEAARQLIPAKTALLRVDGAGHDLGFKGKTRREELPGEIVTEFRKLMR
jgi:predicted alpha/beta-hydrolase family hydrolase